MYPDPAWSGVQVKGSHLTGLRLIGRTSASVIFHQQDQSLIHGYYAFHQPEHHLVLFFTGHLYTSMNSKRRVGDVFHEIVRRDGHDLQGVHYKELSHLLNNIDGDLAFTAFVLGIGRSEEHTSELQSLMRISYAVFCLN